METQARKTRIAEAKRRKNEGRERNEIRKEGKRRKEEEIKKEKIMEMRKVVEKWDKEEVARVREESKEVGFRTIP